MTNQLDPETAQKFREQAAAAEIAFAQNYRVFLEDARAKAILEHMSKSLNGRAVAANLSHGEVMFVEGMRAVYLGIRAQIDKMGASQPTAPKADPFA